MLNLIHKISAWFWGGPMWFVFLKLWVVGMIIQYLLLIHYIPLMSGKVNFILLANYIPFESAIISALLAWSHNDIKD